MRGIEFKEGPGAMAGFDQQKQHALELLRKHQGPFLLILGLDAGEAFLINRTDCLLSGDEPSKPAHVAQCFFGAALAIIQEDMAQILADIEEREL